MTVTSDTRRATTQVAGGAAPRAGLERRLDIDALAPEFLMAMAALDGAASKQADQAGLPEVALHLVRLRVSQINGCAYCVDMHAKDLRAAGEPPERIDGLVVWREAPFYTAEERAALALAEAVTLCGSDHPPDDAYPAAAAVFDSAQLTALVAVTVAINAWNRIGVATRAWLPGSYRP